MKAMETVTVGLPSTHKGCVLCVEERREVLERAECGGLARLRQTRRLCRLGERLDQPNFLLWAKKESESRD